MYAINLATEHLSHIFISSCTAKCQSWSKAKLAEERKKNMPSLPGMESVAKSKIKDGKANALRRSKTITRDMEANRARNVVGGRIRGKLLNLTNE
jgi:hypothetical protein